MGFPSSQEKAFMMGSGDEGEDAGLVFAAEVRLKPELLRAIFSVAF